MRNFWAYQEELLIATRVFLAIWEKMEINREKLQNDIFLSDKQRATMDLDLQADYLRYDDLNICCEELKDLVHESNPRPYHENMVRIKDIASSLSLLRNKVETLKQTIFKARVRLHEASTFNKVVRKDYQLSLRELYPKRRKFIDLNSVRMQLLGGLMYVHFEASVDEHNTTEL